MSSCGSRGSRTAVKPPAGPIMVLPHYRPSPGGHKEKEGRKDVSAGLQVLLTRHWEPAGLKGGKERHVPLL